MNPRVRILAILVALGVATIPVPVAADRCPCGDLLLPYFEIGLPATPFEPTTRNVTATVAVGNCGIVHEPVALRVWSNWGVPVLSVEVEIPDHGVFTANLHDWLVLGRLPGRQLDAAELAHLQAALSGERSAKTGLFYATPVGPSMAAGYVTASLSPGHLEHHVLWGDFFAIDPAEEDAAGESLVRLVDDETRELCRRHLVRFLEGGSFDGHTRFLVWTGVHGWPSSGPEPEFPLPAVTCRAYDEAGNFLLTVHRTLLATQAVPATELASLAPFGWLECDTDTLAFMATQHDARQRFDVALRSFCMAQLGAGPGPGPGPEPNADTAIALQKSTNGEDADAPPGPVIPVGGATTWEYVVTNVGETTLLDVVVTDDPPAGVVCPQSVLDPGEAMTCTASGIAVAGQFSNLATAAGHSEADAYVVATDVSHYFGEEEVPPQPTGDQGCSPGYWKNHAASWPATGYATGSTVGSLFTASAWPAVDGSTLLAALDFGGGPGAEGAARNLLRAGVAALLNAAHPAVDYPMTSNALLDAVNAALAGADRDAMLLVASQLDAANNLGCPLS